MIGSAKTTEIAKRSINRLVYMAMKKRRIDGARILMYHSIGDRAYGDCDNNYNLEPTKFANQLHFLKERYSSDFRSVDMLEAEAKPGVYLTFDDGYLNNLTIAAPVLQSLGIPATIFVCTDFLTNESYNFLRRKDLKELSKFPNITIASHTVTHPELNELSAEMQKRELMESKNILQDVLNSEIRYVSYPYGMFNEQTMKLSKEVGYKLAFCSTIGAYKHTDIQYAIPRCDVRSCFSCEDLEHLLAGAADWQKIIKR